MTTRKDIAALTSLRGIAALAVLIYHSTFGFRGYLGVDLFFLLSGFVLAHVYGRMELSRQTYCGFLKARFARIYPVHFLTLVLMLPLLNDTNPLFSTGGLISSLFLLQAPWHSACWNLVSWSISAEWHAYLVFPMIALLLRNRSNRMLLAALIACALIVGITGTIVDLEVTTHGLLVFLRFLPEFIGGMVLYSLYERGLPKWFGDDATFWLSILALPLLEWLHAPNGLMLCALGMVLLTSATNEGRPTRLLNAPVFAYLGKISYSLYMVSGVVMIIGFIVQLPVESSVYPIFMIGLSLPLAALMSPAFEYPARDWLKQFSWSGGYRVA